MTVVDSQIVQGAVWGMRESSSLDGQCGEGIPCYTYTGTQTVSLQYLHVGLLESARPNTVSFVGNATGVGATPAYMFRGHTVPWSMVDWRWVPRGLDELTKTCQGTVSGCAIKIYETGTLYVDAVVNTFPMTDSIEIYVYCPIGDTALDNSPARDAILEALGKEWRSADPNDPNKANRREQAGYVYQDPSTGKSDWWVNPNQQVYGGDACNSFFGAGPGNGVVLATAAQYLTHVHPFAPGKFYP